MMTKNNIINFTVAASKAKHEIAEKKDLNLIRAKIEADVAQFLANGGTITQCKYGETAYEDSGKTCKHSIYSEED